jgi:hypothetical protein
MKGLARMVVTDTLEIMSYSGGEQVHVVVSNTNVSSLPSWPVYATSHYLRGSHA